MDPVHLWAAAGLFFFLIGASCLKWMIDLHMKTLARRAEVERRNDACKEALALVRYGALEEALELLSAQDEVLAAVQGDSFLVRVLYREDIRRMAKDMTELLKSRSD